MKYPILILFILVGQLVIANKLFFKSYSDVPELRNSTVNDLYRDNNGIFWLASDKGLIEFDGHSFKRFPHQISNDIAFGNVNCVYAKENFIWIGTFSNGLFLYNKISQSIFHVDDVNADQIVSIIEASDGNFWVGSNKGLYILDSTAKHISSYYENSIYKYVLSNVFINDLFEDKDDNIWVGTWNDGLILLQRKGNDLHRLELGKLKNYLDPKGTIMCVEQDTYGNIWVGTWGKGCYLYSKANDSIINFSSEGSANYKIENNVITDICFDDEQNVWLATFGKGLVHYNASQGTVKMLTTDNTAPSNITSNTLNRLLISNNTLWIATLGDGINSADLTFTHLEQLGVNELGTDHISGVIELNETEYLISTYDKGLIRYNTEKGVVAEINTSNTPVLRVNLITVIQKGKDNFIWVGTNNGLYIYYPETEQLSELFPNSNTKVSGNIQDLYVDKKGRLWIGNIVSGVEVYDFESNKMQAIGVIAPSTQELLINKVQDFEEDRNGNVWVGLQDGLLRVNGTTLTAEIYFKGQLGLNSNSISALHEDKLGNLWIGSFDRGLVVLNANMEPIASFTMEDNLPDNEIKSFLEEDNGTIWILTPNGAASADIQAKKIVQRNIINSASRRFFNGGSVLSNGKLLFTGNGVTLFDSKYVKNITSNWKPLISELKIFNIPVYAGDSVAGKVILDSAISLKSAIELDYSSNVFSLHFSTPEERTFYEMKYSYKLEGFDKNWIATSEENTGAHYMNLRGGKYVFRLRSLNANGEWSKETNLLIRINPPFWRTWWFYCLAGFLFLLSVSFFYRLKLVQKQRAYAQEQRLKEQEIIKLKNEKLKAELENQNKQLEHKNSEITSAVVNITRKNEVLNGIKSNLTDILDKVGANAKPKIKAIIREIDNDVAVEKNWEQFITHFNALHKNFLERLKENYPDLSPANLRLCAYLRLNLSSKEIATMMNISVSGVEKSRYRLRKKLELNTEENLTEFIMEY